MVARRRAEEEEKEEEVAPASQSDWAVHRACGDGRLRATGLAGCGLVVRGHSEETAAAAEDHARSTA